MGQGSMMQWGTGGHWRTTLKERIYRSTASYWAPERWGDGEGSCLGPAGLLIPILMYLFKLYFVYLFLVALALYCRAQALSSCDDQVWHMDFSILQ